MKQSTEGSKMQDATYTLRVEYADDTYKVVSITAASIRDAIRLATSGVEGVTRVFAVAPGNDPHDPVAFL